MAVDVNLHLSRTLQFKLLGRIGAVFFIGLEAEVPKARQTEYPWVSLQCACWDCQVTGFQANPFINQVFCQPCVIQAELVSRIVAIAQPCFEDEIINVQRGGHVYLRRGKPWLKIFAFVNIPRPGRHIYNCTGLCLVFSIEIKCSPHTRLNWKWYNRSDFDRYVDNQNQVSVVELGRHAQRGEIPRLDGIRLPESLQQFGLFLLYEKRKDHLYNRLPVDLCFARQGARRNRDVPLVDS